MIAVVDYGAGNLRSVMNALAMLGHQAVVTRESECVLSAEAVVLPGVGAAGDTMRSLRDSGMAVAICERIDQRQPTFAVCVGMQVLFSATEEGGWHECLGVIPGVVRRLPSGLKVPHMGWNQVRQVTPHPIFAGIPDEAYFYFVHSYYAQAENGEGVAATTEYGVPMCSVFARENLVATQFHPEKSGALGLTMYANFFRLAGIASRGK